MKVALLLLVAFAAVALAIPGDRQMQLQFTKWTRENNKIYAADEFQTRFSIWKANFEWINEFNAQQVGFTVAMNSFGDLTNEEFNSMFKGLRNGAFGLTAANAVPHDTSALPTSVDWRTKGAVTGVKNQGQCGSCWSFSATGSLEGAHFLHTGSLVSLSEQNLVDCSRAQGNQGCNGGLMDDAFKYVIQNHGLDTESSYPYTARDGTCHYSAANCGTVLAGYQDVRSGSEAALQESVANVGPVSVAIDASHNSFQFYKSGVYYEPACSPTQLDHGVLAVGYGVSGSSDYWLVKNSWGVSWGQQGYIWMARNRNNNCGIATMASFPLKAGANKC